MAFGQRNINAGGYGRGTEASADGNPEFKMAGTTFAWETFPAAGAGGITLIDGSVIPAGVRYAPFGTVISQITAAGPNQFKYGPYDPAATDGRQTLTRGRCFIMNWSVAEDDGEGDTPGGAIEGGMVFEERIKIVTGGAYVAGWVPAVATAFPRIRVTGGF